MFLYYLLNMLSLSFGSYSLNVFPEPLSKEEEYNLLLKMKTDSEARSKLIEHNLRLVVFLAKKYENTGVDLEDLVSIGTIGLIKGINTFSKDKNIKLATYASRCIDNEILMYLRKTKKLKSEVSIDASLSLDGEGNELHLEDVLGTDSDIVTKGLDEELDAPITNSDANQCFLNDPQINNDKWITCDLADTGTDNFLCLAWNGFHVYDYLILKQTTPRQNAERLEMFAQHHNISNSHIIYDGIRGTYINDYIPEAIPFISNHTPIGLYGRMAYNLKAECYMRLVEAIKQRYISFDDTIANRIYDHANLQQQITIQDEFREECAVVRFRDMPSGKKALMSKKEMNAKLGKNRSMDLLDPCAMRFLPCLEYPYGEELTKTSQGFVEDEDDDGESIYDETLYG